MSWPRLAGLILIALAWGQVQFIRGFDAGSDTTLCVIAAVETERRPVEIPSCRRIWLADPSLGITRAWRNISGDAP